MRQATTALLFLLGLVVCSAADQSSPSLKALYDSDQWFQLRDAMAAKPGPALYEGVVAAAFHDPVRAGELLRKVIRTNPKSDDAEVAWQQLGYLYQRAGQFQRLLAVIDEELAAKPEDSDLKGDRATVASFPWEQTSVQHRYSKLSYKTIGGNLFIPVSINGKSGEYLVDTGMDMSTMSESEALRLGLTIHDSSHDARTLGGPTGGHIRYRTAVAEELVVGNVRLKNVSFLVVPDKQEPFAHLPPGERGGIGVPVLLAFQTIRWNGDGTLEIAFPPEPKDLAKSNLCFDGVSLITEAKFQQRELAFVLDMGDTGERGMEFFPPFAKDFAALLDKSGTKGSSRITGVEGSKEVPSVILPEVHLQVGGFDGVLRPARVVLEKTTEKGQSYYGNLNMAFIRQAHHVSMDFQSMMFSLD